MQVRSILISIKGIILLLLAAGCTTTGAPEASADKISKDTTTTKPLSYYPPNNSPLEKEEKTITLQYITWGCECANWVDAANYDEYERKNTLSDHTIFIEPAADKLVLPDTLGYHDDRIQFTGHFYSQKGYPKGYIRTEEQAEPAHVFHYTAYKVIRSRYAEYKKIETGN